MTQPFTAARARNEGFACLHRLMPSVRYVQFVDGDCEVVAGWLPAAQAFLDQHPEVAVVCGRRRERYPTRSIYNQLCDTGGTPRSARPRPVAAMRSCAPMPSSK